MTVLFKNPNSVLLELYTTGGYTTCLLFGIRGIEDFTKGTYVVRSLGS